MRQPQPSVVETRVRTLRLMVYTSCQCNMKMFEPTLLVCHYLMNGPDKIFRYRMWYPGAAPPRPFQPAGGASPIPSGLPGYLHIVDSIAKGRP